MDDSFEARPHHRRVERTARYYTLGSTNPGVVWFVLHGYGQLAGTFVRYFAPLAGSDSLVVAPEALNRFYMVPAESAPARDRPVGATWMTREDRLHEIEDYVRYLDGLYDEVASTAGGRAPSVRVIGFSQGCATATRWVGHGHVPADALVLWGGLVPPDTDVAGTPALRATQLRLVLGTNDQFVNDEMLSAELTRLEAAGLRAGVVRFEGGHGIKRAVLEELRRDLDGFGVGSGA